jgi:hypothetical protein
VALWGANVGSAVPASGLATINLMKPDPDYLRRLYADLSDLELLDIDRADLTDVARECYDQETARRPHLSGYSDDDSNPREDSGFENEDDVGSLPNGELTAREDTDHLKPVWYDEGAEVYSSVIYPGRENAKDAAEARDVLKEAGVPCFLEIVDDASQEGVSRTRRWRLTVPGHLSLRANSVLETEIFNADFEEEWRVHLEQFSDSELEEMHPRVAFGGLFDRIERVNRLYRAEIERRGLKSN